MPFNAKEQQLSGEISAIIQHRADVIMDRLAAVDDIRMQMGQVIFNNIFNTGSNFQLGEELKKTINTVGQWEIDSAIQVYTASIMSSVVQTTMEKISSQVATLNALSRDKQLEMIASDDSIYQFILFPDEDHYNTHVFSHKL